jgi:tetratricopeptide (TPR) repeat protein
MLILLVAIIFSLGVLLYFNWRSKLGDEQAEFVQLWEAGSYEKVYRLSGERLFDNPMECSLLSLRGFSAYQLALSQINNSEMLGYIDECIWSLRKALLSKGGGNDGGIFYVLGKAYYYKGSGYTDLAIKFLEAARKEAYEAWDIPEYLGLAYAGVQDYRRSVASFSLALNHAGHPSDLLLLSIARSYIELGEGDTARAYLVRCVEVSKDSNNRARARLLLGDVLVKAGDLKGAEDQYLAIINEGNENAEAHYQLGELYNAGGDTAKARAEWRKAVRIDPAYGPARARLNL